jgi:hypothetical protein
MQSNQTQFTCNGTEIDVNQIWRLRNGMHCLIQQVESAAIFTVDCDEDGNVDAVSGHRRYANFYSDLVVFYLESGEGIHNWDIVQFIGTKKENEMQDNQNTNLISLDKQYKTRDGRNVRVLCVDRKSAVYPVLALIETGDDEDVACFTADGFYYANKNRSKCRHDLIEVQPFVFIPEVGRKYKSRIGEVWTILLTNTGDDYSVVAYKEEQGVNHLGYFTVKGEYYQNEEHDGDLIAYAD